MKIKFLGTAAAEGWPALFCNCESCQKARKNGGKNIRTRSSCLINDEYMVDFPPDTYMHVLMNQLDLSKVEHLLVTHSHDDHFYPEDIQMRKEPYAHINSEVPLSVYGNDAVKTKYMRTDVEEDKNNRIVFTEVKPLSTYHIGKASVVPLLADHTPGETCLLYLFTLGGKTLLYGHDTGYFPEETWAYLENIKLDVAILDCTDGPGPCEHYHMGFPAVLNVKDRLEAQHCVGEKTTFVITHFSHNGGLLYDELVEMASPHGFIVSYDGMEISI